MQRPPQGDDVISLDLADHEIAFVLPVGARMQGRLQLPGGALILGEFVGEILCLRGSLIIKAGARTRLIGEAERVYVEGDVASLSLDANVTDTDQGPARSVLIGRQIVAAASSARCNADLYSAQFAVTKGAKVWGRMLTIEELSRRPRPPTTVPEPGKLSGTVSTSSRAAAASKAELPGDAAASVDGQQRPPARDPVALRSRWQP